MLQKKNGGFFTVLVPSVQPESIIETYRLSRICNFGFIGWKVYLETFSGYAVHRISLYPSPYIHKLPFQRRITHLAALFY
jgi:hypothetical protein